MSIVVREALRYTEMLSVDWEHKRGPPAARDRRPGQQLGKAIGFADTERVMLFTEMENRWTFTDHWSWKTGGTTAKRGL